MDIRDLHLPTILHWDGAFKGCKEISRPWWSYPARKGATCSVYILDVNDLAPMVGVPKCNLASFSADLGSAMALMEPRMLGYPIPVPKNPAEANRWPWLASPHYYAQSGAPWLFMEGLRKSKHLTSDGDTADVVFVNDYCYMIWGIAQQHFYKFLQRNGYKPDPRIIDYLLTLWNAITELPRYKKDEGRSFVFWLPDPNTFYAYKLWTARKVDTFLTFSCSVFKNSLHLSSGPTPRWRCPNYHPERNLLVPASSYSIEKDHLGREDKVKRDIFMYFKATCLKRPFNESFSMDEVPIFKGKILRRELVKVIGLHASPDVIVECLGLASTPGGVTTDHAEYIRLLSRTRFCPAIPGDDQNSQHVVENFLAGCINVFVGPPYHALPFEKEVMYQQNSLFLNISKAYWMPGVVMRWHYPRQRQDLNHAEFERRYRKRNNMKWWHPNDVKPQNLISLESLEDVMPFLRAVPMDVVTQLLDGVARDRAKFVYEFEWMGRPGANSIILDNMCHFVGKECALGV